MTELQRTAIAMEIVRRIDTVTLTTCAEVVDIYKRAQSGEFDDMYEELELGKKRED
jgi:hypothetical protein